MDGRLLMARLGAGTARWDGMRGAASDFTAQDIAAALGMIEDEFSRDLFCYLWWPEGSRNSSSDIERMILHRVMKECRTRGVGAVVARMTYEMFELEASKTRAASRVDADALAHYHKLMEFAGKRKWPAPREAYRKLVRGVLAELTRPTICADCRGTGQKLRLGTLGPCERCDGGGCLPQSDLARAHLLNVTWHAYRKAWKAPYEWALSDCRQAVRIAERALCTKLGYGSAAPN